uniref:Uncharacterized protein n=1 Tax=Alexandrium monilatum TaxID=311494 RepID=A0A7S4V648_9DINO
MAQAILAQAISAQGLSSSSHRIAVAQQRARFSPEYPPMARSASVVLPLAFALVALIAISSFAPAFTAPRAGARTARTQLRGLVTTLDPIFTYGEFPHMYEMESSAYEPVRGDTYSIYANWKEADKQTWDQPRTVFADGTPIERAGNNIFRVGS